ncbi:double zinc ribbon and ankyrin repeat-containing protein 1 [Gadus morhua]|uniref:double zinc ribbon and ankyrin repeat-containing protein 1 n=1 Tax=Gadus morhua TaxID=8049 RepID=UPI0011B39C23|nr:double zinc ribbon and ankyrin repeat-containing protein 1 [Gadus morhua]
MAAGSVAAPRLIPLRAPGHGRAGHEVDTATPVEMKSDSTDVQIFYTLDGSSPEAWRTVRGGENSTMRYSGALLLPPGKVSVKAVAVTRDGRQSSTVTKVFLVSANVTSLRGQEDLKDKGCGQETLQWTGRGTPSRSLPQSPAAVEDVLRSSGGARFLSGRLGPQDPQTQKSSPPTEPPRPRTLQATTGHTQSTRVQREADFLRCTRCFCDRPSDPFSRFCVHCGASLPPVPGQRLPPTEAGQMGVCFVCNTLVPVNTPSCLICEAAIPPQLRPQARIKLKNKVLCVVCCSVNPGHISHCVTCENRLVPTPAWTAAPPPPPAGDQRLACSQCQRTNHQDARFCDWCGAKPSHPLSSVLCGGCGASSHPYASYCSACGLLLVAPPRSHASSVPARGAPPQGSRLTANGVTWRSLRSPNSSHSTSQATPTRARAPPTEDRQTQTVGLFYPSGAELQKSHQQRELAEQAAPRRPLLTAVSPGRGYWRQQVDHVCAHLRAYAQNNPHFRTLLGEPRMGRMATVVIKEDDFEVSLRLSFLLGGPEPPGTQASRERRAGESPDQTQTLSSVTEGQNPGINPTSLGKKQPAPRPKPRLQTTQKPLDGLLLKEVGPGGQGGVAVVQQLLDQGADPMCQDSEGQSVLVVAVVNGRPDIIPVLVQRGADVNQQSGPFKNTALHEAASQGSGGLQSAKVLLGCRARMKRNAQGDTPYDLSLTCGCPPMVQLLAAQLGHTLLGTLLPNPARISLEPTATASSSSSSG